jgi:hypothetical protein
MHSLILLLLLFLPLHIVAETLVPQCIQACINEHPTSSSCNGDEKGDALTSCTCASLANAGLLIGCVKSCPAADQAVYAASVPEKCRSEMLPSVTITNAASNTATATTNNNSVGVTQTGTAISSAKSSAAANPGAAVEQAGFPGLVAVVGGILAAFTL